MGWAIISYRGRIIAPRFQHCGGERPRCPAVPTPLDMNILYFEQIGDNSDHDPKSRVTTCSRTITSINHHRLLLLYVCYCRCAVYS